MTIQNVLINVFRTRLYLPLLIIFAAFLVSKHFRNAINRILGFSERISPVKMALLFFVLTFAAGCLSCYSGRSWGDDFIQYFAQTRALLTGTVDEWYEKNLFIINNSSVGVGADVYPWGWSFLLLPVYALTGDNYALLKIYVALYYALAIVCFYFIARRRLNGKWAFVSTSLLAFNIEILISINTIESDIPNLLLVMLIVNFHDWYMSKAENSGLSMKLWTGIVMGIMCFIAKETRTMSFALILALLASEIFNLLLKFADVKKGKTDKKLSLSDALPVFIPFASYEIVGQIFYSFMPRSGGTYNGYFTFNAKRFFERVVDYFSVFSRVFGSDSRPIITVLSGVGFSILLILCIYSFIKMIRKESFIVFFSGGTILMLLFYDYCDDRFIYPVYPFIVLFAFMGMSDITEFLREKELTRISTVLRPIGSGLLLSYMLAMGAALAVSVFCIQTGRYNLREVDSEETKEVFAFIDENISDDEVICFFKPRLIYYYTNTNSYTWFDNGGHLETADYYLWTNQCDESNVLPYAEENGHIIFENAWFKLYDLN